MVISADSSIGMNGTAAMMSLEPLDTEAGVGSSSTPTVLEMRNSSLVLEKDTNTTLSSHELQQDVALDGGKSIAAGTTVSWVDCCNFNADELTGTLALDLTDLWGDISKSGNRYLAVNFEGVSGFGEGTVITAYTTDGVAITTGGYGTVGAPVAGAVAYFDIAQIPEPATGTLSVLALAALAARRRRRK